MCECFNGYEGENCEKQLCRGEPGPCSGHGKCTEKQAKDVLNYIPTMPDVSEIKKEATSLRLKFKKGKYSKRRSVHRVYGSNVVDISIPPPSFKPVALFLSRSPVSKTPKQVFFNPINIFDIFTVL